MVGPVRVTMYQLSWIRHGLGRNCLGYELFWVRVVLGTSWPGLKVTQVRVALGTSCLGYELTWERVDLGTSCPGYEFSWVRIVLGTSCRGYELSRSPLMLVKLKKIWVTHHETYINVYIKPNLRIFLPRSLSLVPASPCNSSHKRGSLETLVEVSIYNYSATLAIKMMCAP